MATTRGRLVRTNQTVIDQADYFQADGFSRVLGLGVADLTSEIFYNNTLQPWPLSDGTGVTDNQVAAGRVYFSEIASAPGYYSLRFRPNNSGYWRLILTYPTGQQILAQDYDVNAETSSSSGGIKASFTNC